MGDRVASLPMYGEIELRPVIEHWWTGVAQHLGEQGLADVPDVLVWPDDIYSHWRSPDLLFSQTCGHPLVNTIAQDVQLVATPHYDVPDVKGHTMPAMFSCMRSRNSNASKTCKGAVSQSTGRIPIRATTCGRPCFPMPNASTHSLAR